MSVIEIRSSLTHATGFERMLIRVASTLDHVVAARVERRAAGAAAPSRAVASASALDVSASSTLRAPVINQLR